MRRAIILPSLILLVRNARAKCYFPDGTQDNNAEYQPCSKDTSNPLSTICCATNREDGPDICTPNGLCQLGTKKDSPYTEPTWSKPSCTNQDWSKDGCMHVCGADKYPFLTPCDKAAGNESTRWCCGLSTDCCNESWGMNIEYLPLTFDPRNATDNPVISSSSSSSSPSSPSTSSPSPSPTKAPSSNPTSNSDPYASAPPTHPSKSDRLSTPATAGIAAGVSLLVLALLCTGYLLYRRRKAKAAIMVPSYTIAFDPAAHDDAQHLEKYEYVHWDASLGGKSAEGSVSVGVPRTPEEGGPGRGLGAGFEIFVHEMPGGEGVGEGRRLWGSSSRGTSANASAVELEGVPVAVAVPGLGAATGGVDVPVAVPAPVAFEAGGRERVR